MKERFSVDPFRGAIYSIELVLVALQTSLYLCQYFDPHEVYEADPCQVQDEGVEGHGLGLQRGRRGTGRLSVGCLLAQFNVTTVEVDITGGRLRLLGTAVVHIKVISQFKLRYGLDLEETQRER